MVGAEMPFLDREAPQHDLLFLVALAGDVVQALQAVERIGETDAVEAELFLADREGPLEQRHAARGLSA